MNKKHELTSMHELADFTIHEDQKTFTKKIIIELNSEWRVKNKWNGEGKDMHKCPVIEKGMCYLIIYWKQEKS